MSLGSSRRTSDDHSSVGSDSSTIMSMHSQIVKYSTNGNDFEEENPAERYQSLIVRLERELTEAQNVNHRLNQQLKALANSSNTTVKNELSVAKKELKEKNSELEKLRKAVTKAEGERSTWLSKQPQDVQGLMSEKKELRKQLDREQNEKHQLLMEMNSMVAQIAEQVDPEELKKLKMENIDLQRQLDSIKANKIAENGKNDIELQKAREELETLLAKTEEEKKQLQAQIDERQRQLDIKSASLQSLLLAKQDTGIVDKLKEENVKLSGELDQVRKELESIAGQQNEASFSAKKQLEEMEKKLEEVQRSFVEEKQKNESLKTRSDDLKATLQASEESLSRLKMKISQFEGDVMDLQKENETLIKTSSASSDKLSQLENELKESITRNEVLEATLKEKDEKIDKTKVSLLEAESRAVQAEEDLKEVTNKALSAERREQQLKAQVDAQGDSDAQLTLLKKDLATSEQRNSFLTSKLAQLESVLQKKTNEISQLTEELEDGQKKVLESSETSQEEIEVLKKNLKKVKDEGLELKKELEKVKEALAEAELEKKKLESKAAVADELTTLMSSLNSVRQENAEYIDELEKAGVELRQLRDELYQEQEDCLQWKNKAHEAEVERKSAVDKLELQETTRLRADSTLQEEKSNFEVLLKGNKEELERLRTSMNEQVAVLQAEKFDLTAKSAKQLKELEERVRKLDSEAELYKKRVEALQEEAIKNIESVDEHRQGLLDKVRALEHKLQDVESSLSEEKTKVVLGQKKLDEVNEELEQLTKRNEKLEQDKLELIEEVRLTQQTLFNSNEEKEIKELKEQLENLKTEYQESIGKLIEKHAEELEMKSEEVRVELEQKEKGQEELVQLRRKVKQLEDEHEQSRKSSVTSEKEHETAKARLNALEQKLSEVSTSKAALLVQLQEQTSLLETEANRVKELAEEKKELQNRCEVLQLASETPQKDSELVAENARLAGELLKAHSLAERSATSEREQIARQFEEKVKAANSERTRLTSELEASTSTIRILEAKIEEQKALIKSTEKKRRDDLLEMEELRNEKNQLKAEIQKLQNGPIAPPRPSTRTISNMSAMTTFTQNDFSDCEDLLKLRGEIDKQKRLIVVLRRKLQAALQSH